MKKVVLIAVMACVAMATDCSKMRMPTFADIDTNKNGMISPKEFQKHQSKNMRQMKSTCRYENRCGMMKNGRKSMMNMPKFSDFDLNSDGYIMESELQEARNSRMAQNAKEGKMMKNANQAPSFGEMDIDKNGKISPREFQQHQAGQMKSKQN